MEAKRAVPRSEVNREALRAATTQSPRAPPTTSTSTGQGGQLGGGPILNMNDYAYNKIFVGGLHYDTREGDDGGTCLLNNLITQSQKFIHNAHATFFNGQ